VQHPNLVAFHDCGFHGGRAFVATEFVEGETLSQYLARAGALPMLQGLALSVQLLSALECAHRANQVHSAIHPGNLLVTRCGQLKLDGTGWMSASTPEGQSSGAFNAPAYLAPEQASGRQADRRADVYAAARVARDLLSAALVPRPALAAVFDRALASSPNARYQSAADFSCALQTAVGEPLWVRPPAQAQASVARSRPRARPPRRWPFGRLARWCRPRPGGGWRTRWPPAAPWRS